MQPLTDFLHFGNIFFNDKTYSPETIRASIDAVAENLTKRFISNSPFVYLFAPNHIKTVYALFGIIKAGRICVLVDPALKHFELEEMMKDSPPGALIRPDRQTDVFDFYKEIEVKHYQLSPTRIKGLDDVAIMLYTAADDGFAKGAMLTHENLSVSAEAIIESISLTHGTVSCAPISYHHLFALQSGVIAPCFVEGDFIITETSSLEKTRNIARLFETRSITHFHAVPFVYYLLGKEQETAPRFSSVKLMICGGNKLSARVANNFKKNTGIDIWEGYGLTETSLAITWHPPAAVVYRDSVGLPLAGCQIRISSEDKSDIPPGQMGEICVRGKTVMKGYFCNDVATQKVIVDGWFHTGDLGKIDTNGYIHLSGLKKRMLNAGGNKIYPAELERFMKRHNNVMNVEVFGEPDELMGDKVKAKVQLRNNSPEFQKIYREWCLENITKYKVPKSFEFLS